jgi:hypothetical protein
MIDHQNEPDNRNRELTRPADAERNESAAKDDEASSGSYYYDDSTGYEIYDEDDECEEK